MLRGSQLSGFNAVAQRPGIQYVGGKTFNLAGSTSTDTVSLQDLTGGISSRPQAGDVVIVSFAFGDTADRNVAVTTGYTEIADLYDNDAEDINLGVFLKLMVESPDADVTIGSSSITTNRKTGAIQVFRGVDPTTPQDAAATTATGTSSLLANPPSITPATVGAYVVAVGAAAHVQGDSDLYNSSDLTNFLTIAGNSTIDSIVGQGYIGPWASGAVNPAAFTYDGTSFISNSWAAVTLALRPKI